MDNRHTYEDVVAVKKMIRGDKEAFLMLYNKYHKSLYAYVLRYVKSPELAEDVLQDVFLKIWEIRKQVNPDLSFPGYLFRVCRNNVFRRIKKIASDEQLRLQVMQQVGQSVDATDLILQWREYELLLDAAINQLPPQRKRIFLLCRTEGKKYDEVATELAISRNTVKEHMVLATRAVKEFIKHRTGIRLGMVLLLMLGIV